MTFEQSLKDEKEPAREKQGAVCRTEGTMQGVSCYAWGRLAWGHMVSKARVAGNGTDQQALANSEGC